MVELLIAAVLSVAAGVAWGLAVAAFPHADPARAASRQLSGEVAEHRGVRRFVRSRLDPEAAAGLGLTLALVGVVIVFVVFGVVIAMVRANSGVVSLDVTVTRWAAAHATTGSLAVFGCGHPRGKHRRRDRRRLGDHGLCTPKMAALERRPVLPRRAWWPAGPLEPRQGRGRPRPPRHAAACTCCPGLRSPAVTPRRRRRPGPPWRWCSVAGRHRGHAPCSRAPPSRSPWPSPARASSLERTGRRTSSAACCSDGRGSGCARWPSAAG